MDIDLTRLRHITAIARTGSFSRAADDLHITQPALSRSIATFEKRFGLRIFDRDRSGVVPTAMGRLVIEEAERVLRAARDLNHNLRLYAKGEGGDLAIGTGPLLAMLLPDLGRHLLTECPAIHLRASVRTPEHLVQELLDDRIELIFGNSWAIRDIPDLEFYSVGSIRMAFVVRAGHPLTTQSRVTTGMLARYPQASAAGASVAGLPLETGSFICDNFHVLRELVSQTDCIWLAAPSVLADDIAANRLAPLKVDDFPDIESEVAMICRRNRTLSPAAQSLVEHLRALLTAHGRRP
ncbi:LysR family transcriptional regulator [Novosphingobium aquae]|uniref:LysR family transcriptional regulator n=1 Tax=Novosphingobium aquae TaxID=3133435 RepID=A0ABU8SDA5_9SPHN